MQDCKFLSRNTRSEPLRYHHGGQINDRGQSSRGVQCTYEPLQRKLVVDRKDEQTGLDLELDPVRKQMKYTPQNPHRPKTVLHWGQRKLLLSEIEFLTNHTDKDRKYIVVYAGCR
jgi:hypothetical protein